MDESSRKRVDESWKEQVEREKQTAPTPPAGGAQTGFPPSPVSEPSAAPAETGGMPEARFDLFLSGLAMEAFVALGDLPHPTTRKRAMSLPHAKYLIDLLGILEEKTATHRTADEERLLKDALYQLRMRYLAKSGGV